MHKRCRFGHPVGTAVVVQVQDGQLAAFVATGIVLDHHLATPRHEPRLPNRVGERGQPPPGPVRSHLMDLPDTAAVVPDEQPAVDVNVVRNDIGQREQRCQHSSFSRSQEVEGQAWYLPLDQCQRSPCQECQRAA
jgi:hypothetical protein